MRFAQTTLLAAALLSALSCREAVAEPAESPTIPVVTEFLPPYQFEEDGRLTGVSTEVVAAALAAAGLTADFEIMPWARALMIARSRPGVLIYSIVRTQDRESSFLWIGRLFESHNMLYALPGKDIKAASLDDLKKFRIGVENHDVMQDYFLNHGFDADDNLEVVSANSLIYDMLRARRIDLWPVQEQVMAYIVRARGDDPQRAVVPVWELTDLPQTYMAFSLGTDPSLVARLTAGYRHIVDDGTFAAIQKKWSN
jgi:polar amino acid transport system substrate-binding protein